MKIAKNALLGAIIAVSMGQIYGAAVPVPAGAPAQGIFSRVVNGGMNFFNKIQSVCGYVYQNPQKSAAIGAGALLAVQCPQAIVSTSKAAAGITTGAISLASCVAGSLGNSAVWIGNHKMVSILAAGGMFALANWYMTKDYVQYIMPIERRKRVYSKWRTNSWETTENMHKEKPAVLNAFVSEFGTLNREKGYCEISAKIVEELQSEIDAISRDMADLEERYLKRTLPFDITLYDIAGEFGTAKSKHALGTGILKVSGQQSIDIDKTFNTAIKAKILPYVFSLNYGYAAQLWRKLNKEKIRLEVLLSFVQPVVAGLAQVPFAHAGLHAVNYDLNGSPQGITVKINENGK
jgi:hypothetical protein